MKTTLHRWVWLACSLVLWASIDPVHAFYNPTTGRWLSRDPIEERGGLNLGVTAKNDVINKVDALGKVTFDYRDADGHESSLGVDASVAGAAICDGGFLHFKVHFRNTEDDQGNQYLTRYGVTASFDGNASQLDNVNGYPIEWDNFYLLSLPFCPKGPQSGTTTFALGMTGNPNVLSIRFDWKYSCNCLCLINDPLKTTMSFTVTPPLYPRSRGPRL